MGEFSSQGAVQRILERRFFGRYQALETRGSVGTSVAELYGNDPERLAALFVNLSANNITLGWTPQVSDGSGLIVAPSGGFLLLTVDDDLVLPTYSINAVAAAAGSNYFLIQIRRIGAVDTGD